MQQPPHPFADFPPSLAFISSLVLVPCTAIPHPLSSQSPSTHPTPHHPPTHPSALGAGPSKWVWAMQVEIRDGQLIGTLGKQTSNRQSLGKCSRLLSLLGPGTFFGSGAHLNGDGELQVPYTPLLPHPALPLPPGLQPHSTPPPSRPTLHPPTPPQVSPSPHRTMPSHLSPPQLTPPNPASSQPTPTNPTSSHPTPPYPHPPHCTPPHPNPLEQQGDMAMMLLHAMLLPICQTTLTATSMTMRSLAVRCTCALYVHQLPTVTQPTAGHT